jgi:hypothetical protein
MLQVPQKGHPATHCPKKPNDDNVDCSLASTASSVKKLKKDLKSMKKAFTKVNTQLAQLKEAESEISESEGEDEASYFQMDAVVQLAQVDKEFEPIIAKLFKQAGYKIKLDIWEVILLDSQYTMDLFCNAALISKTSKSTNSSIMVSHKATMLGYNKTVWFSARAITNIIALRNLID